MEEIFRLSITFLLLPRLSSAVALTGPPYAVRDQSYRFTCTVTGSATGQTLTFRRDGGPACTIAYPLDSTRCEQFTAVPGYSCSCGQSGVYYMNISSVSLQDENTWDCQLGFETSTSMSLSVYWYPAQPTHNCSPYIVEDQTESCTCQTSDPGNPIGTVQWINPQGHTVSSSPVLNLANIPRSDNGKNYICRVGNSLVNSNKATVYRVIIAYGPGSNQIRVTKPLNTVAIEYRDLTLTCETLTSVSPGVTFTWDYSDGSVISGGSTGTVIGSEGSTWSQTRIFQPIRSKTNVRCTVRNTKTAVTATGTLSIDVKWPPKGNTTISDFPSPMYSGDQKTIRCTVTGGNPPADITWSCSNTSNTGTESGSKTSSLTFLVTKQQNRQQCQCRATWVHGGYDKTDTEIFNVYYPPDTPIVIGPVKLCERKPTSLACSSSPDSGNPPATYYWTKNNVQVYTGSPYTFTPVKDHHQAQIRCAAGNNYTDRSVPSRLQSGVSQLNVYYIRISRTDDQTKKEGQSLSLTCSADSNPGNAILSWTFKGSPLTGVSVVKTNLSRSDHGQYMCSGRVNTGSVCPGGSLQTDGIVNVIVNYSPDITFSPVDIREGETLTLICQANGRPESYVFGSFTQHWGDTEVESIIGRKIGEVYTWTAQSATYLDTGVNECGVDNGVTNRQDVFVQKKRVSVHIRAPPKFTTDASQMIGAEIGSPVTLFQTFYNSNLNYTSVDWTFVKLKAILNESAVVRKSQVTLKKNDKVGTVEGIIASINISVFKEQDIGVYRVAACNSIGCNSSDVSLTAAGPPFIPLDVLVTNTTQKSISLRWTPNFPGGDFTQVFILHYRLQGSGDWQTQEYEDNPGGYVHADISDLQPGSMYEFRVRARNNREKDNEGDFTNIVLGTTRELPTTAESNSSIGVGLGIGLGICLPIIIGLVIALIYFRRRRNLPSQNTGNGHQPDNQGIGAPADNDGYISDQAEYAHLEQRSSDQYEQIRLYENTKGKSQITTEYENLQNSSPATYEKVESHTYVNTGKDAKDPAYTNRPMI